MHEETKEEFAVKVFDRAKLPEGDFEKDIKKEVRIMQHLRHPNIVSIHAVLVTTSKMYLVMEFVRGGELYDEIVSRRRIDEDTSRKYFQQLIDAMCYCHRRGVVHRDLKPENLLLDEKGNLKVTDFGMSWMSDNASTEEKQKMLLRTQCGTPKYMAPEIIVRPSKGYDGEKLDAWECGMVLYALLAGYLPFSGEDDDAVFRSILKGTVKFPSFFSSGARSLLLTLLEKNPDKRASLDEVRLHPWFQVNYFGDAAAPPLPESTETAIARKISDDSQDQSYHDARGDSKLDTIPMAAAPPAAPSPASDDRRIAAAAHRKDVMRLNLADMEEDDPFKSGLHEVEVPATPTPRAFASVDVTNAVPPCAAGAPASTNQKTPNAKTTPVTPPLTSPTTPPPGASSAAQSPPAGDDSSAFRQLGSMFSPRLSNVFAVSSRIGSFASPACGGDPRESGGGPASFRERISGSAFGTMYKNLRDGLSPTPKSGAGSSSDAWAQEDSPTSVTNPNSAVPLVPPPNKNANTVPRVPKRKLKKGFKS